MKRVTGIGGIFFKAKDAPALLAWYQRHLGIDVQECGGTAFNWTVKVVRSFNDAFAPFQAQSTHLVPIASPLWAQRLRFRDTLRNNAALAAEYAELKLQLAHQFPLDREAYMDGKTAFVRRVLPHV